MTFHNKDVFKFILPSSGIGFSGIYEWHEAAHWRGYTQEAFEALDGDQQSRIVAHYRAHHRLEAVIAQHQAIKAKHANRKRRS